MDPNRTTLRATGGSMFPMIPAGFELHLRVYRGEVLRVGDVVAYVTDDGLVAHRVVATTGTAPTQELSVRGDAQTRAEAVHAGAVVYRIEGVWRAGLGYRTDGALGRLASRIALRGGLPLAGVGLLARVARRVWLLRPGQPKRPGHRAPPGRR